MSKSFKNLIWILLVVLLVIPASCGKYEDGPWFSMYSKKERASGNWQFAVVKENGIDMTEDYAAQSVNMTKNGDLYWIQGYYPGTWNNYGFGGSFNWTKRFDSTYNSL